MVDFFLLCSDVRRALAGFALNVQLGKHLSLRSASIGWCSSRRQEPRMWSLLISGSARLPVAGICDVVTDRTAGPKCTFKNDQAAAPQLELGPQPPEPDLQSTSRLPQSRELNVSNGSQVCIIALMKSGEKGHPNVEFDRQSSARHSAYCHRVKRALRATCPGFLRCCKQEVIGTSRGKGRRIRKCAAIRWATGTRK